MKLQLDSEVQHLLLSKGMPGTVLKQRPFELAPTTYTAKPQGLKPKLFDRKKQVSWFEQLMKDPTLPVTYCVASLPHDGPSELAAAVLMQQAMRQAMAGKVNMPLWVNLMGGFDNKILEDRPGCSMMILNNVGTTSTAPKLEKLRDILKSFPDIPKVVVAHGVDPYTFFMDTLHLPIHGLCYFTNSSVQRTVSL